MDDNNKDLGRRYQSTAIAHRAARIEELEQLQALLLLISEENYEAFSLMGERSQRSILSLAHNLSARAQSIRAPDLPR